MQFRGDKLKAILKKQTAPVKLFDGAWHFLRAVAPAEAVGLVEAGVVGVGNKNHIRELRPSVIVSWLGGNHTIKRIPIRNDQGELVTGLRITEHKPLVCCRTQG